MQESDNDVDLMQKMRAKAREMINVLQYSECTEEKAKIDSHLSELIEQVSFPGDAFDAFRLVDPLP